MRKANVIRIIIPLIVLCFICSCSAEETQTPPIQTPTNVNLTSEQVINQIYTKEQIQAYTQKLENIEYQPCVISDMASYFQSPAECAQLYEIGIKGLPILIYNTSNNPTSEQTPVKLRMKTAYQMFGVVSLLRCRDIDVPFKHRDDKCKENFYNFYIESKRICPVILSSTKSTEDKADELKYYGLFALPHILNDENINSGFSNNMDLYKNRLLEAFGKTIGLHLSTEEFMKIVSEDISRDEPYLKIVNHPKAEDFDYKAWLDENKEDLDNLFKFLDAYCAEYEAEQNK